MLIRVFPLTLLVAGASLALVLGRCCPRAIGLVAGYRLEDSLPDAEDKAASISCLTMFAVCLVAWALRPSIGGLVAGADLEGLRGSVDAMLAMVIGGGLQTVIFGLFPVSFLEGCKVRRWTRLVWRSLFILGTWILALVLIHEEDCALRGSVLAVLGPFVLFGTFSVLFWAAFAVRKPVLRVRRRTVAVG